MRRLPHRDDRETIITKHKAKRWGYPSWSTSIYSTMRITLMWPWHYGHSPPVHIPPFFRVTSPSSWCSSSSLSFSYDEMSTLVCIVRHRTLTLIAPMTRILWESVPPMQVMHHLLSGHSPDALVVHHLHWWRLRKHLCHWIWPGSEEMLEAHVFVFAAPPAPANIFDNMNWNETHLRMGLKSPWPIHFH